MISEAARTRQEKKTQEALLAWLTLVSREYGPTARVDWLGLKSNFIKTVSPQFTETFRLGGRGALAELLKKKPGAVNVLDDKGFDPDIMIDGSAWAADNASGLVDGLVSNIQGAMNSLLLSPSDGASQSHDGHLSVSTGHGGHAADGGVATRHTLAPEWQAAIETQCSPARATAIGITETTRSISAGEEDFVNQMGHYNITTTPTWRIKDGDACWACRQVKDQECEYVGYPPMHPNCRCYVELVTVGEWI